MPEIAQGNLGSDAKYDVKFENGQLVAELDATLGPSAASLSVKIDSTQILDAIIAKVGAGSIPGEVLKVLEVALKAA